MKVGNYMAWDYIQPHFMSVEKNFARVKNSKNVSSPGHVNPTSRKRVETRWNQGIKTPTRHSLYLLGALPNVVNLVSVIQSCGKIEVPKWQGVGSWDIPWQGVSDGVMDVYFQKSGDVKSPLILGCHNLPPWWYDFCFKLFWKVGAIVDHCSTLTRSLGNIRERPHLGSLSEDWCGFLVLVKGGRGRPKKLTFNDSHIFLLYGRYGYMVPTIISYIQVIKSYS